MMGERGIYRDGWMASTVPFRAPWDGTAPDPEDVVNDAKWELFDLTRDWTQSTDVAAANPEKLKDMQDLFWVEASKYQVLPLDGSSLTRLIAPRPSIVAGRDEFTYTRTIVGIPLGTAPSILNKSFSISAEIEVPEGGGGGMLVTQGGRFAGWAFYLLEGKPVFVYNLLDLERPRVEAPQPLSAGKHTVEFVFTYDGPGMGKGGTGVIKVDGAEVANGTLSHTLPLALEASETFDIGSDTGTGVDDAEYIAPFPFTGTLDKLTLRLGTNG
jgi:arylsulfatase